MRNENERRPVFAKKSFGQNFLADQNIINKIIFALNLQNNESVIEIGAGRGALTGKLIESGARVFAIELDRDLIPLLQFDFGKNENFNLIEQDALKIDFGEINSRFQISNSKLVANLPYYISTAILQKLIEQRDCFSEMILMLQREVVERIAAEAGNKERGFLSVMVQAYLETEKLFDVAPTAFRPAPKVWSSVVCLKPKVEIEIEDEKLFRDIISSGFVQKRKTILNNLKNAAPALKEKFGDVASFLESCRIEPQRRAETLTVDEWIGICNRLN